jgi:Domain of unknown function (DUF4407)
VNRDEWGLATRLLVALGGADREALEECPPKEIRRVALMGATVIVTSSFSAVSAGVALQRYLRLSTPVAVLIATAWGLAVMTIDRLLMISIRRQESALLTWFQGLPRVLLVVPLALFMAKPFGILAFEPEINRQVVEDKQREQGEGLDAIHRRSAEIEQLEADARRTSKQLASPDLGSILSGDAVYLATEGEAQRLHTEAGAAEARALCEADGQCGSHKVGEGRIFQAKREHAQALRAEATAAERRVEERTRILLGEARQRRAGADTTAKAELSRTEGRLQGLLAMRSSEEHQLQSAYKERVGLADRLDALSELTGRRGSIGSFDELLMLVLMAIDVLPVAMKLFTVLGKPTVLEQVEAKHAAHALKLVEIRIQQEQRINTGRSDAIIEDEEIKERQESAERRKLNKQILGVQMEMAALYLDEWARWTRHEVGRWISRAFPREGDRSPASDPMASQPARSSSPPSRRTFRRGRPRGEQW